MNTSRYTLLFAALLLAAATATARSGETLSTETDDVEDRLLTGDGAYDAPPPEPARRSTDGPSEEGDGGPVLVEEAPPGYELHRLRRSGDS